LKSKEESTMQFKGILLGLCVGCASLSAFAAEQVVKEETNPPAAEGAITTDQIQPLLTIKSAPQQPQPAAAQPTAEKPTTDTTQAAPPTAAPAPAAPVAEPAQTH
jgi:hypothetical protein